ncbi:MAG: DUF3489 domain-containing protein [Micropepsaceae bacterium]
MSKKSSTTPNAISIEPKPKPVSAKQPTKVKPAKPVQPQEKPDASTRTGSKIDAVVTMLRAKHGVSITQLATATGWQAHSIRGAISGHLKKKLGLNVLSEKIDGTRRYRIAK